MKKIKIAQIGVNANSHSYQIFRSIEKQKDEFEIVGYVLPENARERLSNKVNFFGNHRELSLEEVLNNPEIQAVAIETDEIYLTKYALLTAKAGKHIHMEKPGGINLVDFENLINIIKQTGKVFHTGYMYRYNPFVSDLIERVKEGQLGEIISVEAQMNCTLPKQFRQWLQDLPGGMMFYLGCHLIDLILQINGQPERIIPLNKCSKIEGVSAKDFGMAVFEYKNGVSFAKTTAVELGGFERRQLVVNGSKATVELNPLEWYIPETENLQTQRVVRTSLDWNTKGEKELSAPCNRYDGMMKAFAQYVRGEKQNPYSPDYELELYKTVLKSCGENLNG